MLALLIFSILFLLLYRSSRIKYKSSLGRGLYLFLAITFASSLVIHVFSPLYSEAKFLPSLYFAIVFIIWITPLLNVKMTNGIIINVGRVEYIFSVFVILLVLPSTFYYLGKVITVFSGSADSMLDVRTAVNNTEIKETHTWSIENFFIAGAQFYVIALYLFFLSMTQKWKRYITVFLLLSSFSFPLYCLSRFGRDGIVYWAVNALLLYSVFKDYYQESTRKKMVTGITIFTSVIAIFMITISLVRFATYDNRFLEGTVGYMGQIVLNFSEFWGAKTDCTLTMFPGLYSLLGIKYTSFASLMVKNGLGNLTNSFTSFVSNLIFSYGYVGTIVISIIVLFVVKNMYKKTCKHNSNFTFMGIVVIMQVPMNGVFYYRQSIGNGDVYLLLSIALLFLFPRILRLFVKA